MIIIELTGKEICLINRVLDGIESTGDIYEGFFIDEPDEYKKYEKIAEKFEE